ncbi:MAG TPA: hypothetical protein VGD67_09340 [Pseudonocardiaceae bacterium]
MAYWSEVGYLDECEPNRVTVAAAEYARIARLIAVAVPELHGVRSGTEWEGAGRPGYDRRLTDVMDVLTHLGEVAALAGAALDDYAAELVRARVALGAGMVDQEGLRALIARYDRPTTVEPLRWWEHVRAAPQRLDVLTGPLSADAELRARADALHASAHAAFDDALRIERAAREDCLTRLGVAIQRLPDVVADPTVAAHVVAVAPGLAAATVRAAGAPHVRLPGMSDLDGVPPIGPVSPALQRIRDEAARIPRGTATWTTLDYARWKAGLGSTEEQFKQWWIADHSVALRTAAQLAGVPVEVLAGVAYQEIGGKPPVLDLATDKARQLHVDGVLAVAQERVRGEPDQTSYGPLAVQVRRAAETLGYESLSDVERAELVRSLSDPTTNIFIAAEHLADLKRGTDFALVAAEDLTAAQRQELAARYNGGEHWAGDHAQDYARRYTADLPRALAALR